MVFRGGKAYLRPFGYLSFKASPPDALSFKRSRLKYWGTLCDQLFANGSTNRIPQHLNNLWLAGSSKLHSWDFLSCIGHLPRGLPHLWGILGTLLPQFLWHLSTTILLRLFRVFQWMPPSFNRYATAIVLSMWKETVSPLIDSLNLWQTMHTVSSSRILMRVLWPFFVGHLPWKDRLFIWLPYYLPAAPLMQGLRSLWIWLQSFEKNWLQSCNSPWASIVGDKSVILPVILPCWQNLLKPVASSLLCMWGGDYSGCLSLYCQDLVLGKWPSHILCVEHQAKVFKFLSGFQLVLI